MLLLYNTYNTYNIHTLETPRKHFEAVFHQYFMYSDICSKFNYLTTHYSVNRLQRLTSVV